MGDSTAEKLRMSPNDMLIHSPKMCIFKAAQHHVISWGCGDTVGMNIRSKGSDVYVKGCRFLWQPELKEKWMLSRLLMLRQGKYFCNSTS